METSWLSSPVTMIDMITNDATHLACLEGFVAECARADDLGRSAAGRHLLEARRALDLCDDPVELVAVRHWYRAAWNAYATWRGWIAPCERADVDVVTRAERAA
jgi:hypothetical protein